MTADALVVNASVIPPPPVNADEYVKKIREKYGDLAAEFLRLYPPADMKESILAATRDGLYGWTAERLARKQADIGVASYLYLFDHGYPAADEAGLHAFHASELPYVFGTFGGTPPLWPKVPDTSRERALSDAMIDYWTSFARAGHPAAEHEAAWPPFAPVGTYMHFGEIPRAETHLMPGMYEFNEQVMCRRRAAGNEPWNWNVGLASPDMPPPTKSCERH